MTLTPIEQNILTESKDNNQTLDSSRSEEFDLLRIGLMLWTSRMEIIRNVFIASVLSVIFAFILPKTYRASTLLMPPASEGSTSGILNSLSSLSLGGLVSQSGDETMSSIAILKSRTVMEDVVRKFDLINVYGCENVELAVRSLRESVSFSVEDEGTIKISVNASTSWFHPEEEEDTARELSANMANYFVERLDIVNKGLKTQHASFQRKFIEGRYEQIIEDLKYAEDSLRIFQENNNMMVLSEQTRVAIEAAASIKGIILANEVQIGVLTTTVSPDNQDLSRLKKETEGLKHQLQEMDEGSKSSASRGIELFPIFSEVPELGIELMRLKRSVEIQNTLFTFLTQQYEEAKIKEAKDTPTVQVLDIAVPQYLKYKPARIRILMIGFVLSTIFSMYYVYFRFRLQLSPRIN